MVLAIGGQMVSSGSITIGELSSFLLYTIYAGSSISGLSSFYSDLMKGVGAASRIFELLDREPTIKSTGNQTAQNLFAEFQSVNPSAMLEVLSNLRTV
jgi:putative ABC transport system ATP-binding protein